MKYESIDIDFKIEPEEKVLVKIEDVIVNKHLPEKYYEIYKCYKEKDYESCLTFLSEVSEEPVEYKILKSACLIHLGTKVSEAHEILNEILEKDPENAFTIYAKGLAFYHEENYNESIEYFEKARYLDPTKDMERAEVMIEKAEEKLSEKEEKHSAPFLHFRRSPMSSHIVRRFGCEICNHFFGKKFNLDRHNRSIHKRSTPHDFPTKQKRPEGSAPVSPKTSPVKIEATPLKTSPAKGGKPSVHQSSFKKGKVRCPTCHHMFKKSSIARHRIIHSGNKPHKCSQCTMAFFQKSDLCRHEVSQV